MSVSLKRALCALTLLVVAGTALVAQALPTTQPKIIQIFREQIKTGHDAAHGVNERGWPEAFAQAKSPDYYLAMVSMTGRAEVWYVAPWESYAAWGKAMARDEGNAELSAQLQRLSMADAEHLDGFDVLEGVAMPDLSHGTFPDLNRTRFWEITSMRLRPGTEAQFAEAAKAYAALAGKNAPGMSWRVYRVSAGLPGPTFLIFSSVQSFGEFDKMMAADEAIMKGATPQDMAVLQKFSTESLVTAVSNKYRLDPTMSYVSAETRATDPAFWNRK
jgi:hypothetical protein